MRNLTIMLIQDEQLAEGLLYMMSYHFSGFKIDVQFDENSIIKLS